MAGGNGVIRVVGELQPTDDMPPPSANPCSSWDRDDIVVLELDASVAGKVGVVHVLDRVVAGGGTNSLQLSLINTIHRDLLENGVGAGGRRERENLKTLHLDQLRWLGLAWSMADELDGRFRGGHCVLYSFVALLLRLDQRTTA